MRYVDDTFILIENPFDTNHVLKVANSLDSLIQFTFELEDSNTLPFLGVLVIKCHLNVCTIFKYAYCSSF